ncbi:MAG TPA: chemotaxis protein CheA [Desulfitobacteriaceae bacterium]|nr:chemotaxis protein CheA [Desulfitobacteriaceae bacterium]
MNGDENNTQNLELGEFLEFYLLDSQEQVEKLGAGLLELEKEGNNISLINDLFRSAHSLKGASGTMGFTPIVKLTHAAEDLLDRLRQGIMNVSMDMIDLLLAVTDRVKAMLAQVELNKEITTEYEDLVSGMKELLNAGPGREAVKQTFAATNSNPPNSGFTPLDFALLSEEWEKVNDAQSMGHIIYQVDIVLAPDTLMKAVRAVMVMQKIESMGTVVKVLPGIEDLETSNTERFSLLFISDELPAEISQEILGISEILTVTLNIYPLCEAELDRLEQEATQAQREVAAALAAREVEPAEQIKPVKLNGTKEQAKIREVPRIANTGAAPPGAESSNQVHTIRVETSRMDNLINLVGEIVITRTRLVQIGSDLKEQYQTEPLVGYLNETNVYLGRLMNDLQESVMRLRMVPIGTVFSRFPRLVRDLSRKVGKEIELVINGEDTELDKTVVELIGDPLMHLIRNSVDHGIEIPQERREAGKPELGKITLDAYHEGNHIAILVSDDGAGLPLDKIRQKAIEKGLIGEREELSEQDTANLIFLPGFSTAEQVTDISGRGVGMDVVKKSLNNLGGLVDIDTRKGQGTTFIIRLPLTLAIIQALLVEVGNEIYAVPLSSVLETLLVNRKEIKSVGSLPMVQLRGDTLPLISLHERFELPASEVPAEEVFVVVVGLGNNSLGLVVDGLRGQQEIVIKSLGDILNNLPGIAGATILGDGKVTLILDIGSLIQDVLVKRKN